MLLGKNPDKKLFAEAGAKAADEAQPISDLRGSEQYRRDVVQVLTARALTQACERAEGKC
jgi:carbon-monoxide dehydrogenase medium subunit